MEKKRSYYDILGVSKDASVEVIRKAWRTLTMKYHPDKVSDPDTKEEYNNMMKEINAAYETLSDDKKRQEYDNPMPEGFSGFPFGDDMFGSMFGNRKQKEASVPPIQEQIEVSLYDLFVGKSNTLIISRNIVCVPCNGTGNKNKKSNTCSTCGGRGSVMQRRQVVPGMISQTQCMCPTCNGSGKGKSIGSNMCALCSGSGTKCEKVSIKYEIQMGMYGGQVITIQKEGHEYLNNNNKIVKGDIQLIIREKEHPIYKRGVAMNGKKNMADLLVIIELNMVESLCGFSREIEYINDTKLYICETDVIKDGSVKMIPDKGVPYYGKTHKRGDLYVQYKVKMPDTIDENIKNKIAEMFDYKGIQDCTEDTEQSYTVNVVSNDGNAYSDSSDEEENMHHQDNGAGGVQCRMN